MKEAVRSYDPVHSMVEMKRQKERKKFLNGTKRRRKESFTRSEEDLDEKEKKA